MYFRIALFKVSTFWLDNEILKKAFKKFKKQKNV